MAIKQLLPNILMGMGLMAMFTVSVAGPAAYALDTTNLFGPRGSGTEEKHDSPVLGTSFKDHPYSGETITRILPDGTKVFTTYGPPKANGEIPPSLEKTTYPSEIQDTKIYNQNGDLLSLERKNTDGSTETFHYDGKGRLTSITNKDPNGLRVIKTCDSANCKDILEKRSSLSSKQGQPQEFGAGTEGQPAGETSRNGSTGKLKLQNEILHHINDEPQVQDWSSVPGRFSGADHGQERH